MDAEDKVNRRALIVGLIALALGLIIGLVVLGWWLFPVQWADFSPAEMGPADQEEWLRMAIDSMVAHYDIVAAQTRYEYLGEDGPSILATVQANPAPQSEQSVQAYSAIVQATPPAAGTTPTSALRPFLIALLTLLVLALAGWVAYRLIRRQPAVMEAAPLAEFPPEEALPEPDLDVEAVVLEEGEPAGQTEAVAEDVAEAPVAEEAAPAEETVVAAPETTGVPGLGVEMAAAAALAAAAVGEEEEAQEPVAEIPETPAEELASAAAVVGAETMAPEPAQEDKAGQELPPETPQAVAAVAALPEERAGEGFTSEAPRMPTDLAYVEGIGPVYAEKLKEIGVRTPEQLLQWGATPRGRQAIAERSGISHKLLLKWINHIDLYRIRGVGAEYAELLEAAGVDTVVELAARNPDHLYQALLAVNEAKKLVRKLPIQSQVEDWVRQAKELPRVVRY